MDEKAVKKRLEIVSQNTVEILKNLAARGQKLSPEALLAELFKKNDIHELFTVYNPPPPPAPESELAGEIEQLRSKLSIAASQKNKLLKPTLRRLQT